MCLCAADLAPGHLAHNLHSLNFDGKGIFCIKKNKNKFKKKLLCKDHISCDRWKLHFSGNFQIQVLHVKWNCRTTGKGYTVTG